MCTGGPSNLGSAVATSMNLTNSSEPMGTGSGSAYKSEPNDMMYYHHTQASDTINQTNDQFLNTLLNDEELRLIGGDINITDSKYEFFIFTINQMKHKGISKRVKKKH